MCYRRAAAAAAEGKKEAEHVKGKVRLLHASMYLCTPRDGESSVKKPFFLSLFSFSKILV